MLTSKQRAYLRSLVAVQESVFHIGKGGITGETITQLRLALEARELIKVRVLEAAPLSSREAADALVEALSAEPVQVIGRCVSLYKPCSKPEKRKITLPR